MSWHLVSWRSGEVEITDRPVPNGAMALFRFDTDEAAIAAADVVGVVARHGYQPGTLLCPGVPEANTDDEALGALVDWCFRVEARLQRELPGGGFTYLGAGA